MQNGFQIEQIEENKSQGFIKIHRSFMNWEWYDDANTMRVFVHLLLRANHKAKKWHGRTIERGSLVSSYAVIADELSISTRKLRTALSHLQKTEEIKISGQRGLYSIFTINNYEIYQENDKAKVNNNNEEQLQPDNETTKESQFNDNKKPLDRQKPDNETTSNKNDKNIKNDKNEKKKNFVAKSFFQKLIASDDEIKKYNFLSDSFMRFLQYKTDIKKQFKTEDSVRSAFLKFVRLSNNNVKYAEALVENTIARGWQTIYDLPKEDKNAFLKNQTQKENQEVSDKWEKYSL